VPAAPELAPVLAELPDCEPVEAELELELGLELALEFELDFEAGDELGVDEAGGVGGVGIDGGVGGLLAQPATINATVEKISARHMDSGTLGTQVGASQEVVQLTSQSGAGRVLDWGHERQRDDGAHDH